MKQILFILIPCLSVSCSRNNNAVVNHCGAEWFQVQIKAQKNIDCGFPEIIFLSKQEEAYQVIGNNMGTYIALGLPKVNYQVGDKLCVKINKPSGDQDVACTMLGISWAHVFISDVK